MKQARFYQQQGPSKTVSCSLCPHRCSIASGTWGRCRARQNVDGKLYSAVYNACVAAHLDPIEKKPLYHFFPGSRILSVGTTGCNFSCAFCQNAGISQAAAGDAPAQELTPQKALDLALQNNSLGIAYTYNEPLIDFEWVLETAQLFHAEGLKNVLVTNGFINPEPLRELLAFIDAANVDVKGFSEKFYREQCGGELAPVLETVRLMKEHKKHVELTTLLIPGGNDDPKEIACLVDWVAGIDGNIPLHFSRYFPQYRMQLPPTEVEALVRAFEQARRKLPFVYLGNVDLKTYDRTLCPKCGAILIERDGYDVSVEGLAYDRCAACGEAVPVVR